MTIEEDLTKITKNTQLPGIFPSTVINQPHAGYPQISYKQLSILHVCVCVCVHICAHIQVVSVGADMSV